MQVGIFDSGLGGLRVARAILEAMPDLDVLYLGDTKRVPYGGRSQEAIHEFVSEALDFLFEQGCHLVILACNTASAEALRASQQHYLPSRYPDRRVLGVLIPCVEAALELDPRHIGVLATASTVQSGAYPFEVSRQREGVECFAVAAPMLVPLVESGMESFAGPFIEHYLSQMPPIDALILGCTHYGALKEQIAPRAGIPVISSEDVIPKKLEQYLERHPEHASELTRSGARRFCVTDIGPNFGEIARHHFGSEITLEKVEI